MLKPWKKLLWLRQEYPDNYTDTSFLSQLRRNTTVVNYSYQTLLKDFSLILLHLSNILLVLVVFHKLYREEWNPLLLVTVSSLATLVAYLVYHMASDESYRFDTTFKSLVLILLIMLILSPVLKSLTNSTSSDSIWALSCWLCIMNFIFNDYSISIISNNGFNSNLSKNLSLSNAIVLLSRLKSNVSVFCFVLFCIEINGLFPIFNNFTRHKFGVKVHYLQICFITGLVNFLYWRLNLKLFVVILVLEVIIVIMGPLYFIRLQKYKDELQGPWDPLKPIFKHHQQDTSYVL